MGTNKQAMFQNAYRSIINVVMVTVWFEIEAL